MLIGIELKPEPVLVLSAAVLVLVIDRGIHALGSSITKNSTCIGWQLTTWRRRFGSRRTDPALDYEHEHEHEHEHEWLSRQLAVGSNTYFSNGTKSKPFANQQSSVAIHQSDRREPQANQKGPQRHRALNPNPSPITNHQSPFINPIAESRKQTRKARSDTGRKIPTLRQSVTPLRPIGTLLRPAFF